jgi:hypothetical protein
MSVCGYCDGPGGTLHGEGHSAFCLRFERDRRTYRGRETTRCAVCGRVITKVDRRRLDLGILADGRPIHGHCAEATRP